MQPTGAGTGGTASLDGIVLDLTWRPLLTRRADAVSAVTRFTTPDNAKVIEGNLADGALDAANPTAALTLAGYGGLLPLPDGSVVDIARLRVVHQDDGDIARLRVVHQDDGDIGPLTVAVRVAGDAADCIAPVPLTPSPLTLGLQAIDIAACGLSDPARLAALEVTYTAQLATPAPDPSPSPTVTPSPTLLPSPTPDPTLTPSPDPTLTPSPDPTASLTDSPSPTPTLTPTPSPTSGPAPLAATARLDGIELDLGVRTPRLEPLTGALRAGPDPTTAGSKALVKVMADVVDPLRPSRFVVDGSAYARSAAVDIAMAEVASQVLTRGLVARTIRLGIKTATNHGRPTLAVPPEAVLFTAHPPPLVRTSVPAISPGFVNEDNAKTVDGSTADAARRDHQLVRVD